MRIRDFMSKDVISVAPDTLIAAARERLRTDDIDHLVVLDGKRLAGVLSGKDLLRGRDDQPVREVMTRAVVTIDPKATIRHAAAIMRGRAIGCLPVVDGERVVGIMTKSDFLTALAKGEIHAAPPSIRAVLRKRSGKIYRRPMTIF